MKNKFWFLTAHSFNKKVKSKWFLIANLVILLAIVGIANIDRIITFFGGDFDKNYEIVVVDDTNYSYKIFENNLIKIDQMLGTEYEINSVLSDKNIDSLKEEIKNDEKLIIHLTNDDKTYLKASVISKGKIDMSYYQYLYQVLSNTKLEVSVINSNIDINEVNKLMTDIELNREILDENSKTLDEAMTTIMSTVFPTIILPVFILVIFLVQMIGTEINEEKSSRSMEIIISNVSPKTHFFSKIVAANGFVLLQGFLLIMYLIIALLVRYLTGGVDASTTSSIGSFITSTIDTLKTTGIIDILIYVIPLTLILLILSFITYSLIAGILASMTVTMEDYQQIQTPIIFILLIGYYLSIMIGMFEGSILIRILSYIPLLSCLLSPALLLIGEITIIDVIISILVSILFNYILIKKGLKIYKAGILNYSTDKMWKRIFTAAKKK